MCVCVFCFFLLNKEQGFSLNRINLVICCHDLKVMSFNPGRVGLGVLGTSVLSHTQTKNMFCAPFISQVGIYLMSQAGIYHR